MLERRSFLKGTGVITFGLASFGSLTLLTAARQGRAGAPPRFSRKKFEALLGSWMHVDMGEGAGWESAQLVDVVGMSGSEELEQFSVRLRTKPQLELQPGVYTLDTGSEAFELYLQPAGSDSAGRYCSAWFSLIRSSVGLQSSRRR
jgi:hypothetical protein